MGVTYTSVRDRDQRRGGLSAIAERGQRVLFAVGAVSALAILLCYAGRVRAWDVTESRRATGATLNLNAKPATADLERVMEAAFENPVDRRFAAAELARLLSEAATPGSFPNVGALGRIDVSTKAVERTRGLSLFVDRLNEARAKASSANAPVPANLPMFSVAQVAALKARFIVRTTEAYRGAVWWCALALLSAFQLVPLVWRIRRVEGDRVLLSAVHLLVTFGFLVVLGRQDPLRDTLLVVRYTECVVLGLTVLLVVSLMNVQRSAILQLSYLCLGAAILLSLALIVFGSGPGSSGAKVNLGPFQPVEIIRPLMACFLAGYLGRRWELLRHVRETEIRGQRIPAWLNMPRLEYLVPILGGVGISLLLFFLLRDLGPALLLSLLLLSLLAVARAKAGVVAVGIAILGAGFAIGYWLEISSTLVSRVAMWRAPWENAVRGGDQVAQALWALATGAIRGTGLGLGESRFLPAGHTDLVLAGVAEELGIVGVIAAASACVVIAWRGLRIARSAPTDTTFFLAVAMTLSLVTPVLVMSAGLLGLLPLTGVVTPFVSYGGSAMVANFAVLGLLVAIGADRHEAVDTTPFEQPLRWLGRALAVAGVVLLVAWARVQVFSADLILVKPQLSLQADGGLRYQYNPRVLEAARTLPRGSVFDRRELPIAADLETVLRSDAEFARLHIPWRDTCPDSTARCYPLGGAAFHVLGDANSRLNWSASNTSYVERDAEDSLRGFDDRASVVKTDDGDGAIGTTLRRDYRDLVPLVRHRWEPAHPAVIKLVTQPRDVHVTLDGRLQKDVAAIVARAVAGANLRHAAVVVLDAPTGEVLASVSYPWPTGDGEHGSEAPDALLDRARYGLYPPGSTFKLVTAAAALRQDSEAGRQAYTCVALPGGRVGAKIPGWVRPIRDDVLDHHAHGTLALHDGLVRSCNAYFAQLAVRVGVEHLAKSATLAGISYPTSGDPARVRENLPYSGYGQGDLLATPLRMARVAAAIGTGGVIREPSLVRDGLTVPERQFLSTRSAQILAKAMRDVVTDGTGRQLRAHPIGIAGKTGTAEVDEARSHAWFVGFAPAGPAARRIAFAVLLENAGYGGATAATVAGQVVTAAASQGWVR
jgi:cell division protein FtsW (lipid II flippase)